LKQRVLVMTDLEFKMPEDPAEVDEKWLATWRTEFDVLTALKSLGHETRVLGGVTDLHAVKETLGEWKPDIVFNLLEQLFGQNYYRTITFPTYLVIWSCLISHSRAAIPTACFSLTTSR
jgi:D-alanine-D-alanine ligase